MRESARPKAKGKAPQVMEQKEKAQKHRGLAGSAGATTGTGIARTPVGPVQGVCRGQQRLAMGTARAKAKAPLERDSKEKGKA